MKSRFFTLMALMAAMAVSACNLPPAVQHQTPSGKVETTINGASKTAVKDRLVNELMNSRYTVTKSDDTVIVFGRPMTDGTSGMIYGSRYDRTPHARITVTLIAMNNAIRVIVDSAIITNPGSGFEQRTDMNSNQETLNTQKWLDGIKKSLEKKK